MDRFHVCEVYFLYLSLTHEGQNSKKYKKLCKLLSYYKPSPMLTVAGCSKETRDGLEELMSRDIDKMIKRDKRKKTIIGYIG